MKDYIDAIRDFAAKRETDPVSISRILEKLYFDSVDSRFLSRVKRSEEFRLATDTVIIRDRIESALNSIDEEGNSPNPFNSPALQLRSVRFIEDAELQAMLPKVKLSEVHLRLFLDQKIRPIECYVPAVLMADIIERERHKAANSKLTSFILPILLTVITCMFTLMTGLLVVLARIFLAKD